MHEQLWDDDLGMVRLYGLHLVRETALGAFLDLESGRVERARRALREVLKHQYPTNVDPRWAGTFKTHAAQPDAGTSDKDGRLLDREWRDYDPNWRQFLGVILSLVERLYGHVLGDELRAQLREAVQRAAVSEPAGRISPSYSNIALLNTWLSGSPVLAGAVADRVSRDGDLAEYNSPTYDAISLMASCLLADFSTSAELRGLGMLVREKVATRLNSVWHPHLALQAGPYTRAYGLDPRLYVSLMSVLMAAIDVPAAGPTRLDNTTTHVHDLYFLPLFQRICASLRTVIVPKPVAEARRHEQRFGDVIATSLIEPGSVTGWERGRRTRFALDQYAPFTMYSADGFIGVRTRADTDWVDVIETSPKVYELRCARREEPGIKHDTAALTVVASKSPITHDNEMLFGDVTLQFPGIVVEVRLAR
ncbi:MAG: hypothetical protein RL072_751 [Actinomycetota bacterium]|jgi:hypothetical protein